MTNYIKIINYTSIDLPSFRLFLFVPDSIINKIQPTEPIPTTDNTNAAVNTVDHQVQELKALQKDILRLEHINEGRHYHHENKQQDIPIRHATQHVPVRVNSLGQLGNLSENKVEYKIPCE